MTELLAGAEITPALPTRAKFALLLNRPPDSAVTSSLHSSIVGHPWHCGSCDYMHCHHILPRTTCQYHSQPDPHVLGVQHEAMEAREVLNSFADMRRDECASSHPFTPRATFNSPARHSQTIEDRLFIVRVNLWKGTFVRAAHCSALARRTLRDCPEHDI